MSDTKPINRRNFIKTGSIFTSGVLLAFHLPSFAKAGLNNTIPKAVTFAPNAFIKIGADNAINILCNHSEMGQGAYTAMTQLIADEMDADWSKITVASSPVGVEYNSPVFGMMLTGGSSSAYSEWDRLRKVGASARAMLIEAAAQTWSIKPEACHAENSYVIETASGKKISYGELVARAATLKAPETVILKNNKDFKFIGKPIKRVDTKEKINGTGIFGMDVHIPGMLTAVVLRPPVFGGKVKSFNADKAKAIAGVKHVVQIERGIAVVATGYWSAKLGREALEVVWENGPLLDTKIQRQQYAAMAEKTGLIATKEGDVTNKTGAAKTLEVVYEMPYLAHAPMEPLNCLADVKADSCDLYIGTQGQTIEQNTAAHILGLKPEQVKVHTQLLGGAFGRRAIFDGHITAEAVQTSKAVGAPVKVIWSREDDIQGGYYRPVAYHKIVGSIDAAGNPYSWHHRVVCQSFIIGSPMEAGMIKDGLDGIAVEGVSELPYDIPNFQVEWHRGMDVVPTLWMRSVGHSSNAFAKECFIDELAFAAGKDPFEYRKGLMGKHARLRNVLEVAADKAGWGKSLAAGHAQGIAVHESFQSFIAQVAEVSVSESGKIKVHKVTVVIDCGPIINPDTIKAQMEGSVVFGMTSAMYGEISFKEGKVEQRNFHDYKLLRIDEAPEVVVHIIESTESMGGVGEPGVPPVAPAIANAVFVLTQKRIRKMPFPANVRTMV